MKYYSVTANRAKPGDVWSFAFNNDEKAAEFAAMVTGATFAMYRATGSLAGFSGCEGIRLFVFEGEISTHDYKLIAVYCNGQALNQEN